MTLLFSLITVQALMGAFDNLWHHEITERLPAKRSAAFETGLHAAREFLYAFIFFALAWYEWRGAWAAVLAAAILIEIPITLTDFVVEDRTRKLPPLERVLHTILAINLGLALALLAPVLITWWKLPTALESIHYGTFSWLFTLFSLGVFGWSVRNTVAVLRHRRPPEWVRNPFIRPDSPVERDATPLTRNRTDSAARHVLISGATGFVGGHLVRRLLARGDSITVYTHTADRALDRFGPHVNIVTDLNEILATDRIDAIVNLAGAPILGFPWTRRRRRILIDSRVQTTQKFVTLAARLERPPRTFISASAIGYYGVRGDEPLDERAPAQPIFQSVLCQRWEAAAAAAESFGTPVVRLRFGLVLGRDGGALPSLAMPVRLGFGAVLGTGRQWTSWIHIDDLTRLVAFTLDNPSIYGVLNAVAPNPATHLEVQRTLAQVLHRSMWLRVPGIIVRAVLGEMAQLLVDGQRVLPHAALASGFTFRYPHLRAALDHLLGKGASSPDTLDEERAPAT